MKHSKYIIRYQKMQKLILDQKTGNAIEFASRIGLSRRMLFNYLDDLRDMGMEIDYCRKRKTYYALSNNIDILMKN